MVQILRSSYKVKGNDISIFDRCKDKSRTAGLYLIFKCVVILKLTDFVSSEPAWFQVCDPGQKYSLNSVDCKLGLWLNQTISVDCVCLNGVWILSSGLCDENAMLLVGSGDCFNVEKSIRSVKLLGNYSQPFSQATYVASEGFDSFVKIKEVDYNPSVKSAQTYVITINPDPKTVIQRSDREVCLKAKKKELFRPVHIWKNQRRVTDHFKTVNKDKCEDPTQFDFHVGFGEVYQDSAVTTDITTRACVNYCLHSEDQYLTAQEKIDKVKNATITQLGRAVVDGSPPDSKISGRYAGPSAGRGKKLELNLTVVEKQTSLRLKPRRRTNIKWDSIYSLLNKLNFPAPNVTATPAPESESESPGISVRRGGNKNHMEGHGVLYEKATPENIFWFRAKMSMMPLAHARETREQSLRMIQAQTNSLLLNQPTVKINTNEYDYFQKARQIFEASSPDDLIPPRIVNGLSRMWRQVVWESHDKFQYSESTNPVLHDRIIRSLDQCLLNTSTTPMFFTKGPNKKRLNTHPCPELTVRLMTNDSNNQATLMPPPHLRFNVTDLDASVELAWKMFMFTFYICSEYFETNANDHSEMAEKIQSLFNYKVLKRWYEPEDFNEAIKVVFPELDLPLMGWAVDRMVGASRELSPWVTWLARPVLPITQPDIPSQRRKRSMDKTTRPPARKRRPKPVTRKRSRFDYWANQAACMKTFTDPVDSFGYYPKGHCYLARIN